MFWGEFTQTIDQKGRLQLPPSFGRSLASGLIITRGYERNLLLFPLQAWQELTAKLAERPQSELHLRAFRRRLFSAATLVTPNGDGRIQLPPILQAFAGLEREAVVTGMHDYAEVWNPAAWAAARAEFEDGLSREAWDDLGI